MDERESQLQRLPEFLPGTWPQARSARVKRELMSWHRAQSEGVRWPRVAARRTISVALGVAIVTGASAMALLARRSPNTSAGATSKPPAPAVEAIGRVLRGDDGRIFTFADGSRVVRGGATTSLSVVGATAGAARMRLDGGEARFEITPSTDRLFQVSVGRITVEVLGTVFRIVRDRDAAHVSVERGRARVTWAEHEAIVSAGESRRFDLAVDGAADVQPRPARAATSRRAVRGDSSWRQLARAGDHRTAYRELMAAGPGALRDEPADLLLAADVARNSGHPSRAEAPLRALLSRFRRDELAPAAAFSLGRLLGGELGRHAEAADAFALARTLAPAGELVEDAYVREVEASLRAGLRARALATATEYRRAFPNGRRARFLDKVLDAR